MNSDEINVGDIVDVNFNSSQYILCTRAKVIYVPGSTGDSWIFKTDGGTIHYVSEGCTITKWAK